VLVKGVPAKIEAIGAEGSVCSSHF